MSDAEIDQYLYDSDQDVAKHHSKLVEAVTRLDKRQRVKKAERSEPSLEISEYHLVKSGVTDKDAVRMRDLIKSLGRKGDQSNIIKKLRYIQQKNKVLPKPLEKPAAERIKRTVGYDKVKEELRKWDSVVARNRTAEQLFFPLKRASVVKNSPISKIPEFLRGFNTKSDLMKKFEELDPTLLYPAVEEEQKDNKKKMTLEEIILRRKEAARLRAQQSYKEAKAHRQRKIKSKKFHRIQRKDKLKQQLKDFESLKDSNPQEALAKLEQLDKTRAEERMSLRHKNTGQWAKNKQIRAKYNKETRQVLAEQLAISRGLTQKIRRTDSDEEDENEKNVEDRENKEGGKDEVSKIDKKIKINVEVEEFFKFCQEYSDAKRQTKQEEIEKNGISDEIILEEEKETRHNEKSSSLQANKNDAKNKLCSNEKSSTLQANKNDTKSKLLGNKKSSTLQANKSDMKNKSCNNEKSSASLANINDMKDKIYKEKKSKEKSTCDNVDATSKCYFENMKNKLPGNKKSNALQTNKSDTKTKSCSNEKSSTSLANTNEMKDKIHKEKKNKKFTCDNVSATSEWYVENCELSKPNYDKQNNKKSKSQDTNEILIDSKRSKKENPKRKLNLKAQEMKKKLKTNNKMEKPEEEQKENEDYSPSLEFEDPKRKPILDSPLVETTSRENVQKDSDLTNLKTIANTVQDSASTSHEVEIDLKKYANIRPKYLKTQLPNVATAGDEDSEQEEETHRIMSEAFSDNDVAEEFRKEQEEEMNKSQSQDIDLSLPGWGSWGGPNIKKNKVARKKSRFILTVPKVMPRKPENRGKVIIFEHENEKLKKHLVKELPYPFTRVKDFEASIRAPISRTFVPMNAHLRLIQPTVKTKLGQVIEPMDENELVKKKPIVKKPLKRISDKKNDKKNDKKKNIVKNNKKKRRKQNVQNV